MKQADAGAEVIGCGGHMTSRAVVWTLAILAVVLVVIPLLSILGMMACCGGMTGG